MKKSTYYVLLSTRVILFTFSFISLWLLTNQTFSQLGKWWSIVCSICNLITILILVFIAKKKGLSYAKLIHYLPRVTKIPTILMGVGIVILLGMGGMFLFGYLFYHQFPYLAKSLIQPLPLWIALINVFILPLTTTLAEDGLYLGIGINQMSRNGLWFLIPALFYALQHSFIPLYFDSTYFLYRFLSFLPLTIVLCYWYYLKRNPVPIMIGHFVINMATVLQIIVISAWPSFYLAM